MDSASDDGLRSAGIAIIFSTPLETALSKLTVLEQRTTPSRVQAIMADVETRIPSLVN
jgi:hypothetical protein